MRMRHDIRGCDASMSCVGEEFAPPWVSQMGLMMCIALYLCGDRGKHILRGRSMNTGKIDETCD
jgi:hypothetical protein